MSVIQLPKYDINGRSADEESTRLHFKKNQPDPPDLDFPPYRYTPYPTAVYREWSEDDRRREVYRTAQRLSLNLQNPMDLITAEDAVPDYETRLVGVPDVDAAGQVIEALREKNQRDHASYIGLGWVDTPDQIRSAKDRANKAIALAAAHRAYDDRHLGEQARAELDAVEDAADDHVLDVEAPKRKPGRPAKVGP